MVLNQIRVLELIYICEHVVDDFGRFVDLLRRNCERGSEANDVVMSGLAQNLFSRFSKHNNPSCRFLLTPRLASARQISQADLLVAPGTTSMALNKPRPRTSCTWGRRASLARLPRKRSPITNEFSTSFSSRSTRRASMATADATAFPPNVEP